MEILPPELAQEKTKLLSEGFADWTKVQFNAFIRASGKYGRNEYEKMAKDIGKLPGEVKEYAEVFWSKGESLAEWDKLIKIIEKGEKRLEEIQRLTTATAKLISMFDNPWDELTFTTQGRIYNAAEDRFLLCLTHLHGYGNWDLVRSSIRRSEHFRFDFYLQSCTAEALGKRCEALMRAAEREVLEIDRKKASADQMALMSGNNKNKGVNDRNKDLVAEYTNQIKELSMKIALERSKLAKMKKEARRSSSQSTKDKDGNEKVREKGGSADGSRGTQAKSIPEGLLSELCKILIDNPSDGLHKCVSKFMLKYPEFTKRQVELKINEIAVKEKKANDTRQVWHIKSEYQHYLTRGTTSVSLKKRKSDNDNDDSKKKPKSKKEDGKSINENKKTQVKKQANKSDKKEAGKGDVEKKLKPVTKVANKGGSEKKPKLVKKEAKNEDEKTQKPPKRPRDNDDNLKKSSSSSSSSSSFTNKVDDEHKPKKQKTAVQETTT